MVVPAGSSPRSAPPPPPLAALRSRALPAEAKAVPQPLALVPQWEDALDPMRPAPKHARGAAFWWKVGGASLAAGALVTTGYLGALLASQHEPRLSQRPAVESVRGLARLEPSVLTSTAPGAARSAQPEPLKRMAAAVDAPASVPSAAPPAIAAPQAVLALPPPAAPETKQPTRSATVKAARVKRAYKLAAHEPPVPADQPAPDAVGSQPDAQPLAAAPSVSSPKLAGATKKAPAVALPEQLSRGEVQAGIEQVRPALSTCAAGAHGSVFANLTIVGTGRVSYSVVEGEFTSGSVGSCMARALRSASIPQFSGPAFKVRYPFVF